MKSIIISLLLTFFSLSILNAQMKEGQLTFSLNAGASLMIIYLQNQTQNGNLYTNPPAIQGNIDYNILDYVSVGGGFSYQKVSVIDRGYTFSNSQGNQVQEDVISSMARSNFAMRILFYYVRKESIEVFSGIRMGFNKYDYLNDSSDPNFGNSANYYDKYQFAYQAIAVGFRLYMYEDLAMNAEIGIGSPHIISFGLSYRM